MSVRCPGPVRRTLGGGPHRAAVTLALLAAAAILPLAVDAAVLPGFSSASAHKVQPQPRAGSCHARGSGLYALPDRRCTPGLRNPAVTPATIRVTICSGGWT